MFSTIFLTLVSKTIHSSPLSSVIIVDDNNLISFIAISNSDFFCSINHLTKEKK